jgi:hypothetical protein
VKLRPVAAVLTAVLLVPLAACGEKDDLKDEVRAALQRTKEGTYRVQYEEVRPGNILEGDTSAKKVEVNGLVEDDFRFKARVDFDGQDGFDEVVSDDTLAMRFIDPSRVNALVNKEKLGDENTETELKVPSLEVLQSRRWVVDSTGAPAIAAGSTSEADIGKDPVLDAITLLSYIDRAIDQAAAVERYDPEDISPAYSSSEDTFPKPDRGSGVTRYDLRRPRLPPPGAQPGGGDGESRPQTHHFRRMAIYVKDGLIVQVRESTDVRGKFLEDTIKYFRTALREQKAPAEQQRAFQRFIDEVPAEQQGTALVQGMNVFLEATGEDPVLLRTMTAAFREHGADVKVDLPASDVVQGSLGFLIVSERGKETEDSEGSSGAGGSSDEGGAGAGETPSPTPTSTP